MTLLLEDMEKVGNSCLLLIGRSMRNIILIMNLIQFAFYISKTTLQLEYLNPPVLVCMSGVAHQLK